VIVDEQFATKRRSGGLVFLVSFIVVAAALAIVLFLIDGRDDTAAPADDTTSTTAPEDGHPTTSAIDETPAFETSCSSEQLPDPDVRYRVTMIPDTFEEPTLNGRNVPSTVAFEGVASRPITAFPEFSELDLTYTGCEVAENGRIWWAVSYTGPDVSGGTFSGIVWSSTKFIEPVPS
jgi:hypothetical protein